MMKRISLLVILIFTFSLYPDAQVKRGVTKKARTTHVTKSRNSSTTVSTASISGLQAQRKAIQRKIKEQERALKATQNDVKSRLQNLMVINSEIETRQKSIDELQCDLNKINGNLDLLHAQLNTLETQLNDRKQKYRKSMQYMYRNRSIQKQLMFIFSAKSFTQMYRRMRFVREYAAYQKVQGELVKNKQQEVSVKRSELMHVKGQKNVVLYKGKLEHQKLQGKQTEQQEVVNSLQKQQKTIQTVLTQQRKMDAALNAKIDQLVAREIAKAKARAEAEARRQAAALVAQRRAAAEAARKRAAELAEKKAAALAAARENARKIAAAKAEEARLKAAAREAERSSVAERAAAEAAAHEAETSRRAAEDKAENDAAEAAKDIAATKKVVDETPQTMMNLNTEDRRISGGFESNRGRLPMPITGSYRVVSHFGQYNVSGLKNVTLDNKGINIQGQSGAHARAIFNGEVSAVFSFGGSMVVMLRHGNYISVYCNLSSVCVHRGQQVSTRQVLGTVGSDNILQFQLRRETAKLNPEVWIGG
jgi:murein hydrolase activator